MVVCLDKTVRRMLIYTLLLGGVGFAIAQDQAVNQPAIQPVIQPAADSIVPPATHQATPSIMKHGPALNTSVCAPDGVALGGYDIVSYFTQDRPQLGDVLFETELLGLRYRFVTAKNRAVFLDDPQRFLPSYRGWCSTNLSMGRLACPDYTNYKIENGQLLFFERVGFTNGLDVWNSDPLLHKRQADQNFVLLSK